MNHRRDAALGICAIVIAIATGCSSQLAAIAVGTGAMPVHERPKYDVPAQVIYRIDDKRYFTIQNYKNCSRGGDVYFHDERLSLRQSVGYGGMGIWPGQFRIEPSDTHIAIPSYGCGDKGCSLWIEYSTDGGKTWDDFPSWNFGLYPKEDELQQTEVVIKQNRIYLRGPGQPWIARFRFDAGMFWEQVRGTYERLHDRSTLPSVVTPSNQDRFTCDTSIKPKNLSEAK